MKYLILMAGFLSGCGVFMTYQKEMLTEDCVGNHLKIMAKKHDVTPEFYSEIVENCKSIYMNRLER